MKFYTNSTSNLNNTITLSGNVGIGNISQNSVFNINTNGWGSIGNPNPSAKLHVYSEHQEEVEKRFFEISTLLARETKIGSEDLRSIYKCLNDLGYGNDEIIRNILKVEKILLDNSTGRDLRILVMNLFIFCTSHIVKHHKEIDYIRIFESLNA